MELSVRFYLAVTGTLICKWQWAPVYWLVYKLVNNDYREIASGKLWWPEVTPFNNTSRKSTDQKLDR